ncbi:MAG: DUF5077 domain-containing protein, partial [Bacteroidia bacterium]|nr:DUF5077 domain-containing protein [Bacteroidia bacterium]
MTIKKLLLTVFLNVAALYLFSQNAVYDVNLSGNAYVTSYPDGAAITQNGLQKWVNEKSVIETFVYFYKPGAVTLSIKGKSDNESVIEVGFGEKTSKISIPAGNFKIPMGTFQLQNVGYASIKLQGK